MNCWIGSKIYPYKPMLKFIYTETALHLELLSVDLADWVEQRRRFAASTGQPLSISTARASMLLPDPLGKVTEVERYIRDRGERNVTIHHCDLDHMEIAFSGDWLSTLTEFIEPELVEGIFVTQLADRVEVYLWQLWYAANCQLVAGDGVMG
jgi:hypothetical protein